MATVRLSDAIVPEVFTSYWMFDTTRKADVFNAGIVKPDAAMASLLSGGGKLFQSPYWGDLDNTSAVIATDNPADVLTPLKIGSFKSQFIRQFRTQGWQTAQLVAALAGSDPMKRIAERVSEYWAREFDRATIATLKGVYADNVANDSGDMVYDASALTGTHTVGNETVNNYAMSYRAILEAKQTMGDRAEGLKAIVMHSRIYTNLQRQNLIIFIPNSQGVVNIPTYLGYRVVVSDNVPVEVDGSDLLYTTYLCGEGVVGWAESPPDEPTAVEKEPLKGNGAGVETLITRRQFALHPYGFTFTDASTAAEFPTDTELAAAANWDRKFPERKAIPLAFIITKNG